MSGLVPRHWGPIKRLHELFRPWECVMVMFVGIHEYINDKFKVKVVQHSRVA